MVIFKSKQTSVFRSVAASALCQVALTQPNCQCVSIGLKPSKKRGKGKKSRSSQRSSNSSYGRYVNRKNFLLFNGVLNLASGGLPAHTVSSNKSGRNYLQDAANGKGRNVQARVNVNGPGRQYTPIQVPKMAHENAMKQQNRKQRGLAKGQGKRSANKVGKRNKKSQKVSKKSNQKWKSKNKHSKNRGHQSKSEIKGRRSRRERREKIEKRGPIYIEERNASPKKQKNGNRNEGKLSGKKCKAGKMGKKCKTGKGKGSAKSNGRRKQKQRGHWKSYIDEQRRDWQHVPSGNSLLPCDSQVVCPRQDYQVPQGMSYSNQLSTTVVTPNRRRDLVAEFLEEAKRLSAFVGQQTQERVIMEQEEQEQRQAVEVNVQGKQISQEVIYRLRRSYMDSQEFYYRLRSLLYTGQKDNYYAICDKLDKSGTSPSVAGILLPKTKWTAEVFELHYRFKKLNYQQHLAKQYYQQRVQEKNAQQGYEQNSQNKFTTLTDEDVSTTRQNKKNVCMGLASESFWASKSNFQQTIWGDYFDKKFGGQSQDVRIRIPSDVEIPGLEKWHNDLNWYTRDHSDEQPAVQQMWKKVVELHKHWCDSFLEEFVKEHEQQKKEHEQQKHQYSGLLAQFRS